MRQVTAFSCFSKTPRMHARITAEPLYVSRRVEAFTRLNHTWAFRIWPPIDQKVIFGHVITIPLARLNLNEQELVYIYIYIYIYILCIIV
jgi:hypothetical protein